jgi:hypothetical protein
MKPWKKSSAIDEQLRELQRAPKSGDTVFTYLPREPAKTSTSAAASARAKKVRVAKGKNAGPRDAA